jgi:hypothetical protein
MFAKTSLICILAVLIGSISVWPDHQAYAKTKIETALRHSLMPARENKISRHPIIVVEADIYVNRNRMVARMRSLADDLELIQGVEAREDGFYDPDEIYEATEDHAKYLQAQITFRDSNGVEMKSNLVTIDHVEIPEGGIQAGQLTNYKVEFEYEFKYDAVPDFITIEHQMGVEGMLLPAELKILMKQAGSDVPYAQMMKPKMPETYRFDWTRPALTQAASDKEWEEWFDAQREKSMGLMQYSAVYSFFYINQFDVRHEVLIPIATLTTMLEIEREDPGFLSVEEQDRLMEQLKVMFSRINPVVIDGIEVKPVFDKIDFFGLGLADLAMQTQRQPVSVANGRAGVIMSYSTKGSPTSVELTWDQFNHVVLSVDSVIIQDDNIEKRQFSKFLADNTFKWQAPERAPLPPITNVTAAVHPEQFQQGRLILPLASALLVLLGIFTVVAKPIIGSWKWVILVAFTAFAIAPLVYPFFQTEIANPFSKPPKFSVQEQEASQIFAQLHKNMFRAFDYRNESDIYDALAKSVDGELLRKLYLQINQSLKMKEQGGTVARIDEVDLLEGQLRSAALPDGDLGFGYRSRWNVAGTVEHWGHVHQRVNEYDANFIVKLVGDNWKIVDLEMVDEAQGKIKTTLRRF